VSFTITSALSWWAQEQPDRVAISVEDQPLTYAGLYDWSARLGQHLLEEGVRAGDRVVVIGSNSMEYAVLQIALVRIGAIVAPLSFRCSAREIEESCTKFAPALVFADHERAALATEALGAAAGKKLRLLSRVGPLRDPAKPVPVLRHEPHPDDAVFIIGTSGSTGQPKGVIESHRAVVTYSAEFVLMEPRCGSGASVLHVGPFSSSSGTLLLMQFLVAGNTIYIESHFKAARALQLLMKHRIAVFLAVPIFFERIAALEEFADADLSGLYFSQTAGARIPATLLAAWRAKGVILRHAYGCTEAGGAWAARDDVAISEPQKCGRGGMFTRYAIRAPEGGLAPPGVAGEILIRSACLSPGYWNDPEATAATFVDGWLHTADLGVMDETGNLTFLDRLKDIIISGGLNISALEVENVIAELEGVDGVAVVSTQHPEFGETPLAIVQSSAVRLSPELIVQHCLKRLARYKVPRYVVIDREPLPRLTSGKISKVALREKYRDAAMTLKEIR
jgi:fatty-acyl-CoA synthase